MKRALTILMMAAAPMLSAACAFESTTTLTAPSTLPTATGSSGSSGDLLGIWASQANVTIPTIDTCQSFSWEITSQSDTSIAGNFTAQCGSSLGITGTASGTLVDAATVNLSVSGAALVGGVPICPFSISGVGTITNNDTLTIPYSGDTCLGPVHGTETLHRKKADDPAPEPEPQPAPPPPPPAGNPYHVPAGDLSAARAQEVVFATANEFPGLTAPRNTEAESRGAAEELLRRVIWHLHLIGYDAGRQKNPSGAISGDKVTIFIDGSWHNYDIFIDVGTPGLPIRPAFTEIGGANPQPDAGIPD